MARIRTLKPEWLEDEKLAALSDTARLLSAGLILLADDQGRGRANPALIAAHVWPYDTPSPGKVDATLTILAEIRFVVLYVVDGQRYYQIRNWHKHQRVDHPAAPRLPGPPTENGGPPDTPVDAPEPTAGDARTLGALPFSPNDLAEGFNEQVAKPYHLPAVTLPLSVERARKAKFRILEHPEEDWWATVFYNIGQSPFLRGQGNGKNGGAPWRITFDWLVRNADNPTRVHEGSFLR